MWNLTWERPDRKDRHIIEDCDEINPTIVNGSTLKQGQRTQERLSLSPQENHKHSHNILCVRFEYRITLINTITHLDLINHGTNEMCSGTNHQKKGGEITEQAYQIFRQRKNWKTIGFMNQNSMADCTRGTERVRTWNLGARYEPDGGSERRMRSEQWEQKIPQNPQKLILQFKTLKNGRSLWSNDYKNIKYEFLI